MAITRAQQAKQLLALGGRIGLQEGGIMPRLNQLGSGVSSAEQMLQGINQRLESAESSLGGGGAMQQLVGNAAPFMGRPALTKMPGYQGLPSQPSFTGELKTAEEAYAAAQKQAQESRKLMPNAQVVLPGETSFEVFSKGFNPFNPSGLLGNQFSQFTPPEIPVAMQTPLSGIPAAGYADGGITSLQEPRQGYFLGKIVKKAKKAVKKVAKSPIGKAALAAALFKAGGGFKDTGFLKTKALPFLFGTQQMQPGIPGTPGLLGRIKGMGTLGQLGLIGGISGIAGLLAGREAEEEEDDFDVSKVDRGEGLDIDRIVRLARMNDPQFRFLPGAEFTGTYAEGGKVDTESDEYIMDNEESQALFGKFPIQLSLEEQMMLYGRKKYVEGGRINLANGGNGKILDPFQALVNYYLEMGASQSEAESLATNDYEKGIDAPKKKAEGGLMSLGGMEMDLRGGGFVPIGAKEKADDVPARLSKNEFVMTADAVRAAGGGSIDKGADKMYNLMKDLESRV